MIGTKCNLPSPASLYYLFSYLLIYFGGGKGRGEAKGDGVRDS